MAAATRIERFASWIAELSADAIPEQVRERGRLQAMNTVAAGLAGSTAPAVARLREATSYWAAPGEVGVIGSEEEWEPAAAAYANAAASMAHDWDDYLYMGHTGHSAVPTARAFTDDPRRSLVAQVAANEVAGRLGAALLIGPHNGQFWSSIHCASSATAAAVALGLDSERLAHALAIALYQPPYGLWPGFMGPSSKLLTAAQPALQGAQAALLAREGMDGPLDVIEHSRGLLSEFADVGRPRMLGALGRVWLTDTLAFKSRPGCAYLQAAVDAACRIDLNADEIASIDVEAGLMTVAMDELSANAALTPVAVNFSTPLSVALAVSAGRLTHEELDSLGDRVDEVSTLASRITVRHSSELTLRTAEGLSRGGASVRDIPLGSLPSALRRARAQSPLRARDAIDIGAELLRRGDLRAQIARLAREARGARPGIDGLDPEALRMTFPCRLHVRLRSGRELELEGEERGGCGAALEEQRAVVDERSALVATAASR